MTTQPPRWLADKLTDKQDEAFLTKAISAIPGIEPVFRHALMTPLLDRRHLITEVMEQRQDPIAERLDVPPLWQSSPQERASSRAWMAEFLAPAKLRDAHQAAEWTRIDDGINALEASITGRQDVQASALSEDEQQRLGRLMTRIVLERDPGNWLRIHQHIKAGDSQLARWVSDTARLQNLNQALSIEADWPEKKGELDLLWVTSGGGTIRSESGRDVRRKLVLERQDLHRGVKQAADYTGDKVLLRILSQTPGKEPIAKMVADGDRLTTPVLRRPLQHR